MIDQTVIRTARLELRPFRLDDLSAFLAFNSNPEARRFMGGVVSKSDSESSLDAHIKSVETTGLGARAVVESSSDSVLGYCGLQRFAVTEEIELFYGYLPTAWGRGVATEAAHGLVSVAQRCDAIEQLVAIVREENVASMRVLEKLRFRPAGTYLHPRWHVEHLRFQLATGSGAA